MSDIDTTLTNHLRVKADQAQPMPDIDAVASGHRRLTAPLSEPNDPRRRGLLTAAAVVLIAGVGGLFWAQSTRNEPATSDQAELPSAPAGRQSGSIEDPNAIDFSAWVAQAPLWPTGQPTEYLIFDVAALDGWIQLDQTGGHQIDDGANYHWTSNVKDPEGRQFHLSISNSVRYPQVAPGGETVDIDGVAGNLGEGEVSWPIDDTHTATVVEFGAVDTGRVVALARELTTTTAQRISTSEPALSTGVGIEDLANGFGGTVDGVRWSASPTPDSVHYVIDDMVEASLGISHDTDSIEISETGNNDLCVFVTGFIPNNEATVRLVLSDSITISLPTHPIANGRWFSVCLPYALDAIAVDVIAPDDDAPFRHQLHGPYLQPTIGSISP
jgi:hypothetical protein